MRLESSAFAPGEPIPALYTCEGGNISPPLSWSDVPKGAQSLVMIMDDPDAPDPAAPQGLWVHWVIYNLPPQAQGLPEGVKELPPGARNGRNDWGRTGYGGPCPPVGRHRYVHKLYALDRPLDFPAPPTKAQLEQAMQGHVLAHASLIGTYEKAGGR